MLAALLAIALAAPAIPEVCEPPPARDVSGLTDYARRSGGVSVGLDSVATWCFDGGGGWTGGHRAEPGKKLPTTLTPVGDCARALAACKDAKARLSEPLRALLADTLADIATPYLGVAYTPKRSGLAERPLEVADCDSKNRGDLFLQAQARMDVARLANQAQNEYQGYRAWLYREALLCAQRVARGEKDLTRRGIAIDTPVRPANAGAQTPETAQVVEVTAPAGAQASPASGASVGPVAGSTSGAPVASGAGAAAGGASASGAASGGGVGGPTGAPVASGAGAAAGGASTSGAASGGGVGGSTAAPVASGAGAAAGGASASGAASGGGVGGPTGAPVASAAGAGAGGASTSGAASGGGVGGSTAAPVASGAGAAAGGASTSGAASGGGVGGSTAAPVASGAGAAAGGASASGAASGGGVGGPTGAPVASAAGAGAGGASTSGAASGNAPGASAAGPAVSGRSALSAGESGALATVTSGVSGRAGGMEGTPMPLGGPTQERQRALASSMLVKWRYLSEQRALIETDADWALGFLVSRELRECRCPRVEPKAIVRRLEAGDDVPALEAVDDKNTRCELCLQDAYPPWRARIQRACAQMDEYTDYELGVLQRSADGSGIPPRCFDASRSRRAAKAPAAPAGPAQAVRQGKNGDVFIIMQSKPQPDAAPVAVAGGMETPNDPAPIPPREDGRLYYRLFMSRTCVADVEPGPIQARTGDLMPVPIGAAALVLRSPCGGMVEVYFGKEPMPRLTEVFGKGQPLRLQFKKP